MKNNIAIKLNGVSKKYTLHHEKPTLIENILNRNRKEEFWALKDINLEVKKGERIGVIGPNGSGKSTLLKIIAGITSPTTGDSLTSGKVVSLIELEAGFHPELTGIENIYLNGLLVGMTKEEIKDRLKKIISFASIGKFIDVPLYTYSDGMKLRLGFSIIAHTEPDIVLIDENLAVGDQDFKIKSFNKINEFLKQGKTIIFVSHLLEIFKNDFERLIWMDEGRIYMDEIPIKVIRKYRYSQS